MFEKRDARPGMIWKLTLKNADQLIQASSHYARTWAEVEWVDGRWGHTLDEYDIEEVPDPFGS